MRITFKPYLLERRQKENGLYPIYIRITQNRRYSLLYTGIDIPLKYWRDNRKFGSWIKGGKKTGHPSADVYNNKIETMILELERIVLESGDNLTRKQLVKLYKGEDNGQFQSHAERYAKRLADEGKYSSQSQIKAAASKFADFAGEDLRFNEITPQLLNEFQEWQKKERDNHPNTIRKTMNRIKAIHNDAYKKDLATNLPFQSPKFEKVSSVQSKKTALSIEQIRDIEKLDLDEGSDLWHVRNYFLFSFWNAGIRFTDLALLRWDNVKDGRLSYTMGKNDKDKDIKLMPQAKEILEPYRKKLDEKYKPLEDDLDAEVIEKMKAKEFIFPIIDSEFKDADLLEQKRKAHSGNARTNKLLKDLASEAEIETNVTFHISRHSFSRWADNGDIFDRKDIQGMLAHSKMRTTERYLASISEYNVDDKMEQAAQKYEQSKKENE